MKARQLQPHPVTRAQPGRSALALFYLGIFPAHEIASILQMTLEELSALLADSRERLRAEPLAA